MLLNSLRPWYARILCDEQGEGGEGGGGNEGGPKPDPAMEQLKGEATALRNKSKQLLDEKKASDKALKALQESIDKLGGTEGLTKLAEFQERLQGDELGKLLSAGKTDEWFDKRSEAMRADHANQIEALNKKLAEAEATGNGYRDQLSTMQITQQGSQAALESGVLKEHLDDVALWIKHEFVWSDEHSQPVVLDSEGAPVYGKDGTTPMGISEWLEGKKESKRQWWPESKGGGATGQGGGGQGGSSAGSFDNLPPAEFQKRFKEKFGKK